MKIGLVGYQNSGKSTLFEWLTGVPPDPSLAHGSQSAMAEVPDDRIAPLCEIYKPKKITRASLELVDTAGLSRTHEGNAGRLARIREAGCLVVVVAAHESSDPVDDLRSFEEDLLLADLEIVSGRIERLREQIKKPRPDRDELKEEVAALEPIEETLGEGRMLNEEEMSDQQLKATRAYQLLSRKPRLIVLNAADDEESPERWSDKLPDHAGSVGVRLRLELELSRMEADERTDFLREMDLEGFDRNQLLRLLMETSGQIIFFTAGDKEVRTWLLPRGSPAVEAAGNIHTDMARGFIRAETMRSEDLIRCGSEREMKAQSLVRQEPKDYVVQEGDILLMRFNV